MKEVFNVSTFIFPYTNLHFHGLSTGERILFVTRESPAILYLRRIVLFFVLVTFIFLGLLFSSILQSYHLIFTVLFPFSVIIGFCLFVSGYWWVGTTYKKSVFIITTRRLTKIIYTTPFTWYQFSLGLDEIADTGSYSSSYFEALFHLGYFVARSGAAAIKNFKIVNISFAGDLHNYVNKLLFVYKNTPEHMSEFRPFIPHLKKDERKKFLEQYPEYKTEF